MEKRMNEKENRTWLNSRKFYSNVT